jgi:uncharacterized protein YigE (DUF2233 family)
MSMCKCKQLCVLLLAMAFAQAGPAQDTPGALQRAGISYTNVMVDEAPWSIQLVAIGRAGRDYQLQSYHAGAGALGMETVSAQVKAAASEIKEPVAAINGGFYLRDLSIEQTNVYAGWPRGLQIVEGEVLAGPSSNTCFWLDFGGQPHQANVASHFEIRWPDGRETPFQLNGPRADNGVELYTPAVGRSTHTVGGRELVLAPKGGGPWLPLRMEREYLALVSDVAPGGNTLLTSNALVLSLGPAVAGSFPGIGVGAVLRISTRSVPALPDARNAIAGGPALVHNGRLQKVRVEPDAPYEMSSLLERHPRTAVGWNDQVIYLAQVDGRQKDWSVGMTADELAEFLLKLGCTEAINLDGGGSSCLWFAGQIRNHPCDGFERSVANSLIVFDKRPKEAAGNPPGSIINRPGERSAGGGN